MMYSREQLNSMGSQRSYKNDASEVAFLLGGIGTGNISLGARGELRDWEIFNRPAKGNKAPFSFFSIWMKPDGEEAITRILESKMNKPYRTAHGYHPGDVAGLPHIEASELKGEYPFVWIDFKDNRLPVEIRLEAFTPFIPLNSNDSGVPGAVIRYRVKNTYCKPVSATVAGSIVNLAGFKGFDVFDNMLQTDGAFNKYKDEDGVRGIFLSSSNVADSSIKYGSMAMMTSDESVTVKENWIDGEWWDGIQDFWDDFSKDGKFDAFSEKNTIEAVGAPPKLDTSSLGISYLLQPGEEKVFEFTLSWYFPNRLKSWDEDMAESECGIVKNYYSTLYKDAWDVGRYLLKNIAYLEKGTRDFHCALFGSSLPDYVIDSLASNITVIRSNTCFRIEDGTFLAYEGCHDSNGSCEGTCTHVWNYAQTLAFLFPDLERSARRVEFNIETDKKGRMSFRTYRIFNQASGIDKKNIHPAADGQMGTIVRLYREWKLSGDDEFLRSVWENAVKALEFAFSYWDTDGDFVFDGQQHNTYDIEFYGPNSLTNSLFYAALKAGAEMAEYLGYTELARKYLDAMQKGSSGMDELLWNGEYYIQKLDDVNHYRHQYGEGCLSDQLIGQFLAHVSGLGYVLPQQHVKEAVKAIYKYNFRESMEGMESVQRVFALNDEKGLLMCSWPKGGRPKLPFVYSDEVWTGVEYQVAALLIYEGFIDEGLSIVKAVRDRYDGYGRNPWDEIECGHHYARSLSSWGVLLALSGFECDLVKGEISFRPVINKEKFSTFWSTGRAWGIYRQNLNANTGEIDYEVEVLYGSLEGVKVKVDM